MKVLFSPKCFKQLQKIKKTDSSLFTKVKKQLMLFEQNPEHPSLRLHKLSGGQKVCWSISINMSYRLLFYYQSHKNKKSVIFFSFGTHDQVYK